MKLSIGFPADDDRKREIHERRRSAAKTLDFQFSERSVVVGCHEG